MLFRTLILSLIISIPLFSVKLTLKEKVFCNEEYVRVGDIFEASANLESIVLFKSPQKNTKMSLMDVTIALEKALPNENCIVDGKEVLLVINNSEKPLGHEERLTEALKEDFVKHFKSDDGQHLRIRYLYEIPPLELNSNYEFRFDFEKEGEAGIQHVKVSIYDKNGKKLTWFEIVAEIYPVKNVVVASKYIGKNTAISKDMLEIKEFRADRIPADSVESLDFALNKVTSYYIKNGNIIRNLYLKDNVVVRKGDSVMVSYENNGISIETTAKALDDGSEGDTIRLENSKTKRGFHAIVEDGKLRFLR